MRANKRFQPTASLAALASRRLKRGPLCGASPAGRKVVRAFCVALRHSVLSSMCARRRVCGWVVLRGSVRVAGTRGRER